MKDETPHVVAEARPDSKLGGFRCTRCGAVDVLPNKPMPVTEWLARSRAFIREHRGC